jgi:uncharacterized protein YndB with AHSA1/START domain
VSRIDRASRVLGAAPDLVYAALVDPDALSQWLPPAGMRAEFERYDARPGGGYRMVLTYLDSDGSPGKSTSDSDIVEARFVALEPGIRVVQKVQFESDDPTYAGTMTMTWALERVANGTRVEFRAEDAPPGISAEDHEAGLASSLRNLAAYLSR